MRPSTGSRLVAHLRAQWAGLLALFLVLAGGSAYAADTIFSSDIVDGEVRTLDISNSNGVRSVDVRDDTLEGGGLATEDIAANALTGVDINESGLFNDNSLTDADIDEETLFNDDSLTGKDILESDLFNDNSLTGDDISNSSTIGGSEINESSLSTVPSASKTGNQSLQVINFHASNGSGASGGGGIGGGSLGVTFNCPAATGDLSMSLRTAVDNASLAVSDDDSYFDVEDFDIADGDVDILTPLGGDSDEIINFVYTDGSGFGFHKVVSGQFQVLDEAPAGTQSECVVSGHAIFSV
jgi:hypothetical protein